MTKTALIIPYFGKWPEWMDFYLYTCSRQKMVDFIYFTDCGIPEKIYPNTKFFETDFPSYCRHVSQALGISFNPEHGAYKLCDCKPFYGIIHKKELKGYDYWGFADIDLVYGDLSVLLNEENYRKYDFISVHSDKVSGHFIVMRNTEKYNNACLKIPEWKEKLEMRKHQELDEQPEYAKNINPCYRFINSAYWRFFKFFFRKNRFRYFDFAEWVTQPLHKKSLFKEYYTTPVPLQEAPYYYDLRRGKIITPDGQWYKKPSGRDEIYLHFLFFKKTKYRQTDIYWRDGFYKIPRGFDFENEDCMIRISTSAIEPCLDFI